MGTMLPPTEAEPTTHAEATGLQKISWILYDWANSGYGLIVVGPVFGPYFIKVLLPSQPGLGVAPDGSLLTGLSLFGTLLPASTVVGVMVSISMALMALAAPVLGAVADIRGWTKRLLIVFGVTGAALTVAMLGLGEGQWLLGSVLFIASNVCFGTSLAFANAFLPYLARPERQGSLSGWGFAAGYVGGALALILVLMMISGGIDVRWGLALSGLWWLVFALPAYITLPHLPPQFSEADHGPLLSAGFRRIGRTLSNIHRYKMLFLFLLAFLLYNDGVETVISMSPTFGTEYLRLADRQLIIVFLIVQFVAFVGAVLCGYLADRFGNKPVIVTTLVIWILAGLLAFLTRPETVEWLGLQLSPFTQFAALGVLIGLVLGGVQASSRALMGLLAPENIRNEAFGFFSISGKFASIFGPLLYGAFAWLFGSRFAIFSVLPFLIAGLFVLLNVREPRRPDKTSGTAITT